MEQRTQIMTAGMQYLMLFAEIKRVLANGLQKAEMHEPETARLFMSNLYDMFIDGMAEIRDTRTTPKTLWEMEFIEQLADLKTTLKYGYLQPDGYMYATVYQTHNTVWFWWQILKFYVQSGEPEIKTGDDSNAENTEQLRLFLLEGNLEEESICTA